jgi:hypothetical protein
MGRGTHRTTPSPSQGGYGKFIRDFIVKQKRYGLDIGHQNGHKR